MIIAKTIATLTLIGIVAPFLQPAVAEQLGLEPMPVWAQFGIAGMIAALHWWTVAKTIPSMSNAHKEGLTDVAGEVRGLRSDLTKHMDDQIDLLKETLIESRRGK